jgi:hypothetical protein
VVLIFSETHILNPEKWEVCGCPKCLVNLGLERRWVYDPEKRREISLLLPLQRSLPGCSVPPLCSEMLNSENESRT